MAVDKLVDSAQLDANLTSVANAIRSKAGISGALSFPSGMVSAINGISTGGGTPNLQSKSVTYTSNGTDIVTPSAGYDGLSQVNVTIDVPSAATAELTLNIDLSVSMLHIAAVKADGQTYTADGSVNTTITVPLNSLVYFFIYDRYDAMNVQTDTSGVSTVYFSTNDEDTVYALCFKVTSATAYIELYL